VARRDPSTYVFVRTDLQQPVSHPTALTQSSACFGLSLRIGQFLQELVSLLRILRLLAEETRTHAAIDGKLWSTHNVIGDSRRVCGDQGHRNGASSIGFRSLLLKDLP
jgi:hypothetical protein